MSWISIRELQEQTGAARRTLVYWASSRWNEKRCRNPIRGVRKNESGHFEVDRENIKRVREHQRQLRKVVF